MPFIDVSWFCNINKLRYFKPTGFMDKIIDPDTLTTVQQIGIQLQNGDIKFITALLICCSSFLPPLSV